MDSSESLGINSSNSDLLEPTEQEKEKKGERKVQNSLFCNRYLPYHSELDGEAEELLEAIKLNLSLTVQKHELWPGALYWTNRLRSFLKMFGFQFSKEDHIKFIHLLYQLVIIPKLESPLLHSWSNLLTMLLKKPKTLSREDLTLPWRPLYDVMKEVSKNKFTDLGMKIYSTYFTVESTQEMLDEWRPYLCPFDLALTEGITALSLFLPTLLPLEAHHKGFKMWFEELLKLWLGVQCGTSCDEPFIKLFVRLARETIGHIDWNPYLPQIYSRILRSFQLPVGPSELRNTVVKTGLDPRNSASFIVSTLGGQSKGQEHLNSLMLSLESFYHPSNHSRQTRKLLNFIKEISSKFIIRLKNERFSTPRWYNTIPDHAKLTETDIDTFVQCIIPAMKMAIFSKFGTMEAALTLHNLALVRPEMVLPDLLNSTYTALETLTEPHQVLATLQCLTAVSRELLCGGHGRYPEGKKHLFSLLTHILPGIDSNDFRKTLVSGLLISALVTMVPMVDSSSSIGSTSFNMTEDEKELCSLTSSFEDFIVLYLDRCFALVENTRLEQVTALDRVVSAVGKDFHESIMGAGISGSVHTILAQSSPQLFKVALDKLYQFATTRVFETQLSGRLCADMCGSASKVNAEETLKLFIPRCLKEIDEILADPYQTEAEYPDHALSWNLQLLSQLLQSVGVAVLPYADDLLACLKRCIHLKSKLCSKYAAEALNYTLQSLTTLYPLETRSIKEKFDLSPEQHLYIRDWSVPVDEDHADIEWHVPSQEELRLVDRILVEFLQPEMDSLKAFMAGKEMEREKLNQTLELVKDLISGAATYFPMWEGPQVGGCPTSVVDLARKDYVTFELAKNLPEQFSRDKLARFIHELTEHIMKTCEDDTKSLFTLVALNTVVLSYSTASKQELENKWRAFKYSKAIVSDKLRGRKSQIRPLLISRVHLQHESRLMERTMSVQTELHHILLSDLLKMAVSEYAQVRVKAQNALAVLMDVYLYAGRKLLPLVLPCLRNEETVSHEQFKGALHMLLMAPMMNVYTHDWSMLRDTLPVIVQADHSEKPSIQRLMTKLTSDILSKYEHFTLEYKISEGSVTAATALHHEEAELEREKGKVRNQEQTATSIQSYETVVKSLVELSEDGKLQWRYSQIAINFVLMLIRHDHPLPIEAVRMHTHNLVHDALKVRKMAILAVGMILQQQKRKAVKVPVDVAREAGVSSLSTDLKPGEREDNVWLCYDPDRCPVTEEQWNNFKFIDKTHWGYYTYPKELMTFAPYKDQPSVARSRDQLSESEQVLYDAFSSEEFVEKLVGFFSMEEVKGHDHFSVQKYLLFKHLFRNFGPSFLSLFRPHIEKHALDSQHESHQRFASEIIAAIVSGSKKWDYSMVEDMKSFLEPLMAKVLDAFTPETISDWSSCMTEISANRDPRRLHWMFQLLMNDPLHGENGSFKDASRLYLLQSLLAQQEWRVSALLNRLTLYLQTHLAHSYKNVRERIGSVLSQVYVFDAPRIATVKFNPRKEDLVQSLLKKMPTLEQLPTLSEDEATLKLCKTCLVWLVTSFEFEPVIFPLISELLPLVTVENDDETGKLVKRVCSSVAHAELSQDAVPMAISALKKAIETGLWKVRVVALQMLQVLLFNNLFMFIPYSTTVTDLLVSLCENSQMEVRELVASSISGLVRCGYIKSIDKLKKHFVKQSRCKLPKKQIKTGPTSSPGASSTDNGYDGALMKRHSGVLGLAALVEACPYSVPEWLPDILDEMAEHLQDPAPIHEWK